MRTCTTSFKLDFKKEMSNIEIEGIEAIVKNVVYSLGELYGEIDGFAYTSSSSYAMISVQNLFYILDNGDELDVSHFAITEKNDMLIMICHDDDENEYYFEIEPIDFYD